MSSNADPPPPPPLTAMQWYTQTLNSPQRICSPMVGQSELAFRMLCRRHGCDLAYTPMAIAAKFCVSAQYRSDIFSTCKQDRPLFVQFCGNDAQIMLRAAKMVEAHCDAVDINLGCPQEVARRGPYGAFLMSQQELIEEIVTTLVQGLTCRVTVKIRIFDDYRRTLQYVRMLARCGVSLLTVHTRLITQREEVLADWQTIARLRRDVPDLPIVSNGDMWHVDDVRLAAQQTGAHGFMCAQGLLCNPALFEPLTVTTTATAADAAGIKTTGKLPTIPPPAAAGGDNGAVSNTKLAVPQAGMRRRRIFGSTTTPRMSFSWKPSLSNDLRQQSASAASSDSGASKSGGGDDGSDKNDISRYFSSPQDVRRQLALALEYVGLAKRFPPSHPSVYRRHIFFMLFDNFQSNVDQYDALHEAVDHAEFQQIIGVLASRAEAGKIGSGSSSSSSSSDSGGSNSNVNPKTGRPRTRRRDGSLAPPPWPPGGDNGWRDADAAGVCQLKLAESSSSSSSSSSKLASSAAEQQQQKKRKKMSSAPAAAAAAPSSSSASSLTASSATRKSNKKKKKKKVSTTTK
jgi:tRNA-dihydrouridine synthase